MRRMAALVMAAILAGLGAVAGEAGKPTPIEGVVPANAVALAQANDLAKLRTAFGQSALAQAVRGSRLLTYLSTVAGAAADFGGAIVSGLPADEFRACLGQHAAVALLDFKDPADLKQRVPIVLLVEAADPKRLGDVLAAQLQLVALLRPELAVATRQQGGTTVTELTLPNGVRLAYGFRGSVLVAGSSGAVGSLLEAGDAPRIASNPVYQAVRQKLASEGGLSVYVDLRALMDKFGVTANQEALQKLRAVGLAGATAAGLAVDFDGRQVRDRLFIHTGGQRTGVVRFLTDGEPVEPIGEQLIPADYAVALQLGIRGVGLWDRARNLLVDIHGDVAVDFLEGGALKVQEVSGIHPKTGLLDTFSDAIFIGLDLRQLSRFHGTGRQPAIPDLPVIFGTRLRDAATLAATGDRIAVNEQLWKQGVERSSADHAGVKLLTFKTPFDPELRPTYAILGDMLLLSLRPEPVAAAIDRRKAKPEAAPQDRLKAGLQTGHLHLRVNDGQVLTTLLASIRKELPEGVQRLLPELDRVLAGLHGYQATLRGEPEGVLVEARSDLGTLGTLLLTALIADQAHPVFARRVEADFGRIGSALEAYEAKKGAYPETLDQLVPDFLPDLPHDRFQAAVPYGYSRCKPGPDGQLPKYWLLTSVGPNKSRDIPVEQFDPVAWLAMLKSEDPDDVARLKAAIYRFHPERYNDERKNDDEGDLYRIGGKAAPAPGTKEVAPKVKSF